MCFSLMYPVFIVSAIQSTVLHSVQMLAMCCIALSPVSFTISTSEYLGTYITNSVVLEPEGSLLYSLEPTTGLYPEPV
jgi:hypothetical protein